jgi:hypothetical protein
MRVDECGVSIERIDMISIELVFDYLYFNLHDAIAAKGKIRHGDIAFYPISGSVQATLAKP